MRDYSAKDFEDVIAFSVSEPGAMGPNDLTFFREDGSYFRLDYNTEKTPWSRIREWFPMLKECCFNGPMRKDPASAETVVIGDDGKSRETRVPKGWKHRYLDYGNHLVIRDFCYSGIMPLLEGYDNAELTFDWAQILTERR